MPGMSKKKKKTKKRQKEVEKKEARGCSEVAFTASRTTMGQTDRGRGLDTACENVILELSGGNIS